MIGPDFRRGYLRVPLAVWLTVFCRAPLTRRQLQIVSVVIRESWGWQSRSGEVRVWTRRLASRQLAEATGLSTDHLARDLRLLLDRGVLREQEGRYQFVWDTRLWKSPAEMPRIRRSVAPNRPHGTANRAATAPDVKIGNIEKRNVAVPTGSDLSTTGENVAATPSFQPTQLAFVRPSFPAPQAAPTTVERLVDVVRAFVGALSVEDVATLRTWAETSNVAAVWAALEPHFRRGPMVARQRLASLLADARLSRSGSPNVAGERG